METTTLTRPRPTAPRVVQAPAERVEIPQYSLRQILAIWAAAALPMGALAWIVAPWLSHHLSGPSGLSKALLLTLTAGLIWQFVLVVVLVAREQRSLRWTRVRQALWLNAPTSPRSGRRGGRVWLIVPALIVAGSIEEFIPQVHHAVARDMFPFLQSHAGHALMSGSWGWFAVIAALAVFNTVLGEELLFRGLLLPRMNGVFGDRDWLANGVLFGIYHLHVPWAIPAALFDSFVLAYPSKRTRSALVGIAVHSAQSVVLVGLALHLVTS